MKPNQILQNKLLTVILKEAKMLNQNNKIGDNHIKNQNEIKRVKSGNKSVNEAFDDMRQG